MKSLMPHFRLPPLTNPKEKPKSEKQRFTETAKDLECDESEQAFEDSFERIVPPKSGNKGDEADSKA
jgi:hypothetical protein